MSIQNFVRCIILLLCGLIVGCARQGSQTEQQKRGQNFYKMSCTELAQENPTVATYKKAMQHINAALAEEKRPEYFAQKATLLFLLRHIDESFSCFKMALDCDMNGALRAEIMNNYACLLGAAGKQTEALRIFKDLEKNKDYMTPEVALVNQAKVYFEQKDYMQAKKALLRASYMMPSYVDTHYYLAVVNIAMNNIKEALDAIESTLLLEPNHEQAKLLKQKIC